ncbi:MAG TPA: hypothetical protein DEQ14_11210, partial [Treponema sp.]|nr:hypothetical protein [Treponema sp.]
MTKLKIYLENCYGIKKMEATLDFSEKNIVSIYAPNGIMKTSFAKTFEDICTNNITVDRIFHDRLTKREIKNDANASLAPEEIFVIKSYVAEYESDKVSTLLVNKELRKEYESIYEDIDKKKQNLLKNLKKISGFK